MGFWAWLSDFISKKALLIAFVHWYVTFFIEKNFFVTSTLEKPFIAVAKLFVIICFWQIAFYMVRRYKQDPEYRRYIHFAGAYFIFSMVVLLLIWPGNWLFDDLNILSDSKNFIVSGWLHILSGYFYFIALFIAPTPVSIVILQIAIISLIVGYLINCIGLITKSKLCYIAFIPFFFPPVLVMNFYPLRPTLFGYLILFFTTKILFIYLNKKSITASSAFFISIVVAIIATLRGEGIVYVLIAPFLFFIVSRKITPPKIQFVFLVSFVCFLTFISTIQSRSIDRKTKLDYQLTTYATPMASLVKKATSDQREYLLSDLNKYLDSAQFLTIETDGALAIWERPLTKNTYYEKGNNKKLIKAYLFLVATYPKEFLIERIRMFNLSNKPYTSIPEINVEIYKKLLNDKFSSYINKRLRASVLDFIDLWESPNISKIFHNNLMPMFLLLLTSAIFLIKKHVITSIVLLSPIFLILLVFLTAPSPYFMYYFPIYLTGYAFAFSALSIALTKVFKRDSALQK